MKRVIVSIVILGVVLMSLFASGAEASDGKKALSKCAFSVSVKDEDGSVLMSAPCVGPGVDGYAVTGREEAGRSASGEDVIRRLGYILSATARPQGEGMAVRVMVREVNKVIDGGQVRPGDPCFPRGEVVLMNLTVMMPPDAEAVKTPHIKGSTYLGQAYVEIVRGDGRHKAEKALAGAYYPGGGVKPRHFRAGI